MQLIRIVNHSTRIYQLLNVHSRPRRAAINVRWVAGQERPRFPLRVYHGQLDLEVQFNTREVGEFYIRLIFQFETFNIVKRVFFRVGDQEIDSLSKFYSYHFFHLLFIFLFIFLFKFVFIYFKKILIILFLKYMA
jgi:hypothetical protein